MSLSDPDKNSQIDELRAALSDRDATIAELRHLVEYLRAKPFRPSSESYDGMTALFDEAEQDSNEPKKESPRRTGVRGHDRIAPVRRPLPENLLREVLRHELPAADRQCSCCGGDLHEIGIEATEQLDIIPAKARVLRHERVKYACRGCAGGIVTATMPKQPIPKSMASAASLAHIATAKYADHLPLYRQEAMWARLGVTFDRGTLASWMVKAGTMVQPIINILREDILDGDVVHCDETTVQVLREKGKKATSPGYMWVLSRAGPGPAAAIFEYDPSRSGRVAERLLSGFRGVVVTDGFSGYNRLTALGMTRAACWAHVRRKVREASDIDGKGAKAGVAIQLMELIQALYEIESRARDASVDERLSMRRCESLPLMARIEALLDAHVGAVLPKSPTGRALGYLRDEWRELQVFLRNGKVPIDNTRVENAIRPFALGRKNWLFSSTAAGAKASANLYTLVETAKANGLDPNRYLARVFAELPNATTVAHIEALLPYGSTPTSA